MANLPKTVNHANKLRQAALGNPKQPAKPINLGSIDRTVQHALDKEIAQKRVEYEYDYEFLPKLALCKEVPNKDKFSDAYIQERLAASMPVSTNALYSGARVNFDLLDELDDYHDLIQAIPRPKVSSQWDTDDSFAEQRLSGANPMVIKVLKDDDPRAEFLYRRGDKVTNQEVEDGYMYVCDYTGTDKDYRGPALVQGGSDPSGQAKYLPKPLAFFRWNKSAEKLEPVGIVLDASRDTFKFKMNKEARMYHPQEYEPNDWLFAKMCVQAADSYHHEMSTHLARCHFTMEPLAVCTRRTIPDLHPLGLLLEVHFRFIIGNNSVAHYTLVAPSGNVDNLMSGTLRESMALLTESYEQWNIKDFSFPEDIANRGLDNDQLPHYAFRDDGMPIWDALKKYVNAYLSEFYPNDNAVKEDKHIQAWAKEAGDQYEGAKVKGFPKKLKSLDDLVDIVTNIIFLSGPLHSAVNFAQYEYMAHAPNMPLGTYANVEILKHQEEPISDAQILQFLPNFQRAMDQLSIVFNLTAYKYDRLGNYDKAYGEIYGQTFAELFADSPGVLAANKTFQEDLASIEIATNARNADRAKRGQPEYPFMLPSNILNSTSI